MELITDVIFNVSEFADYKTVLKMRRVSRMFLRGSSLGLKFRLDHISVTPPDCLKHIIVDEVQSSKIQKLLSLCTRVNTIDIWDDFDEKMIKVLSEMKFLNKITVWNHSDTDFSGITCNEMEIQIITKSHIVFPRCLKKLKCHSFTNIPSTITDLEISLATISSGMFDEINKIVSYDYSKLKILKLTNVIIDSLMCPEITTLINCEGKFRSMKMLDLEKCSNLSLIGCKDINVMNSDRISKLGIFQTYMKNEARFINCRDLTVIGIFRMSLLENMFNLENFNCCTDDITDLNSLTSLKRLTCSKCGSLTNDSIKHIIDNLEYLDCSQTKITLSHGKCLKKFIHENFETIPIPYERRQLRYM